MSQSDDTVPGWAEELAKGIALITAWIAGDMTQWGVLASEGIQNDAVDLVGELTHLAGQLARSIAATSGEDWPPERVLQMIALRRSGGHGRLSGPGLDIWNYIYVVIHTSSTGKHPISPKRGYLRSTGDRCHAGSCQHANVLRKGETDDESAAVSHQRSRVWGRAQRLSRPEHMPGGQSHQASASDAGNKWTAKVQGLPKHLD